MGSGAADEDAASSTSDPSPPTSLEGSSRKRAKTGWPRSSSAPVDGCGSVTRPSFPPGHGGSSTLEKLRGLPALSRALARDVPRETTPLRATSGRARAAGPAVPDTAGPPGPPDVGDPKPTSPPWHDVRHRPRPHSRPGSAAYLAAASKDSGSKRQPKPVSPKPSPPMTDRCDQFPARTTGRRVCGGPGPRHRPSRHTGGDRTALHAEVGPRGPGDSLLVLRRPSSSWSIQRVVDPEHCARQLRSVHPSSSQPHRRPLVTPLQASHGSRLGLESTSQ